MHQLSHVIVSCVTSGRSCNFQSLHFLICELGWGWGWADCPSPSWLLCLLYEIILSKQSSSYWLLHKTPSPNFVPYSDSCDVTTLTSSLCSAGSSSAPHGVSWAGTSKMASWHTRVVPHLGWPEQPGAIHAGLSLSVSLWPLCAETWAASHSMVV